MEQKNHLYEIPVNVRGGPGCHMPANFIGAYVVCYASAADHLEALKNSVLKLKNDGYIFENIQGEIHELDPLKWQEYVREKWNEFKDRLPTQDEILLKVEAGEIFCGPFAGYETI